MSATYTSEFININDFLLIETSLMWSARVLVPENLLKVL